MFHEKATVRAWRKLRENVDVVVLGALLLALAESCYLVGFSHADIETVRAALSTAVGVCGVMLGLLFVGVSLVSGRARSAAGKLRRLMPKYLQLLASGEGSEQGMRGIPLVEIVRQRYAKWVSEEASDYESGLPEHLDPFGSREALLYDLSILTYVCVQEGGEPENYVRQIETDLVETGAMDEEDVGLYVRPFFARRDPVEFFELLQNVFSPTTLELYTSRQGGHLCDVIWEHAETHDDIPQLVTEAKESSWYSSPLFRGVLLIMTAAVLSGTALQVMATGLALAATPVQQLWLLVPALSMLGVLMFYALIRRVLW